MTIEEFKKNAKTLIERLKIEVSGVRAGRATVSLVENILIDYYNQKTPLKQLASLTIVPPREIRIQPWDKEAVSNIVRTIETSSLGLSVNTENNVIRVYLPELSGERRDELVKHVKKETEKFRIELRHLRDLANKAIQAALESKNINEDAKFKMRETVQKETDTTNAEIEKTLENKIKEISE